MGVAEWVAKGAMYYCGKILLMGGPPFAQLPTPKPNENHGKNDVTQPAPSEDDDVCDWGPGKALQNRGPRVLQICTFPPFRNSSLCATVRYWLELTRRSDWTGLDLLVGLSGSHPWERALCFFVLPRASASDGGCAMR